MRKIILSTFILVLLAGFQQTSQAQIFKTKLRVTVVDKLGNVVEDAKVILYKSKQDFDKEQNEVQPYQLTDRKGRVTFKNLQAIEYFVLVRKGDLDNFGGGVKISALSEGKVNKSNIVITDGL